MQSKSLLAFSGAINIILGLALIFGHPVWEISWRVIITLLGYLMLFIGIMRFGFTDYVQQHSKKMLNKGYWIFLAISIILGIILTYHGFFIK